MKIAKASTGYIVLSSEIFLAQHNEIVLLNIVSNKIKMRNKKILPMEDVDFESSYLDVRALMDKFDYKSNAKLLYSIHSFISWHNKYVSNYLWNNSTYD